MAQTVAFALLGAFLLSLTYIPMMSSIILSKKISHKMNFSDRLMAKAENLYRKTLLKVLRIPKTIFAVVIALFVLSIVILSRMGGEFIPSLEEGDFAVDTRVLPGSNLKTTIESTQKAAHILKTRFPEVQKVVTKIGSGEVPTDPMPMDASDMMVILKDKSEWTSAKTFPELSEKMSKALEDVPGITVGFQYPVQMRFNELMTGARQDVVLKIFGEDLETLVKNANHLGKIINTVKGTQNLYIEPVSGLPQVIIQYNRPVIAQYHLSIGDINRVINTAFAGQSTGLVFEGEKRFDMVVRLNSNDRKNLDDVRNLLVPTPSGNQIPLSQLATVDIKDGPNQIQRENGQRRIVVGFNIKNRDVQGIVEELQAKVEQQLKLPPGYYVTYGGSFENLKNAKNRLMIAVPIALVLIFVLLFLAFNSVKESLLIYTAIPLSIIGGVLLLAARGMPFSISAGVGFIALFGVAVLNGIVLISEFNRLYKGGIKNIVRIVVDGGEARLRPVLMTAFVASLGFIPMALSNGAGAEVQRPLATVVIGGLLIATLLTLFVLPLLYVTIEKGFKMKNNRKNIITPVLIIFFVLTGTFMNAQTKITLNEAIDIALKNNRGLKNEKLKSEYAKALIKTSSDIPQTGISADYGQINSAYNDMKFGGSQSIAFPTVYKKQKNLYTEEWKKSELSVALKEYQLKKGITLTFYNILYWQEKEKILNESLDFYGQFLEKATLRLKSGESNILEKSTAANQKSAIEIQIKQVKQELRTLQLQLQWLLNSETEVIPDGERIFSLSSLQNDVSGNPSLKILEQQKNIATRQTALEKSKLLPGLQLAYNLNSFRGMGADDKVYNASPQFHSVQVGVSVPIFSGGQKARIQVSKIAESVSENDFQNAEFTLKNQYKKLSEIQQKNLEIVSQYEKYELKNAETILETAQKQFINGEINYLEFVMLANQAISIKNNYTDAVWNLNESNIELEYITLNQ